MHSTTRGNRPQTAAAAPRHLPRGTKHIAGLLDEKLLNTRCSISTGFKPLDWRARLRCGGVALLAGHRGSGKTNLALGVALNAAREGTKVIYCACKNGHGPIVDELLTVASGERITYSSGSGFFSSSIKGREALLDVSEQLRETEFYLSADLHEYEYDDLIGYICPDGSPALVVIDELPVDYEQRKRTIASLKSLARRHDVAVLALAESEGPICDPHGSEIEKELKLGGFFPEDFDAAMLLDDGLQSDSARSGESPEWTSVLLAGATKDRCHGGWGRPWKVELRYSPQLGRFIDAARIKD